MKLAVERLDVINASYDFSGRYVALSYRTKIEREAYCAAIFLSRKLGTAHPTLRVIVYLRTDKAAEVSADRDLDGEIAGIDVMSVSAE